MIKIENECVGCPSEMGCMGSACPYINVPRYYCDKCMEETEKLYRFYDDYELCENCLLEEFEVVEYDD